MSAHEHDHRHNHEHDHNHEHGHDHGHGHECGCGCDHDHHEPDRVLDGEPTFSYRVIGVDCPSCALNVQNAVRTLSCVEDARLVYATATLDVIAADDADPTECKRAVLKTVRECGEDLEMSDEELEELQAKRSWFSEHREPVLMSISAFMLVSGLVLDHVFGNEARAIPFYIAAAVAGLVFVAPMAVASLRRKTADMNVLMSIAVLGALAMGFAGDTSVFSDAAIVIFLDQVGEWLEGWSMRKTSGSVRELMELAPNVAHVVAPDGDVVDVQTKGVKEGYTIRVLPGERVPLDGVIVSGASSFNEAPVTGESVPQDKGKGAEVYAGSLNEHAVVDIKVTADEDCTTLARIVSQVQGAQAEKAPYESFVNRFAAAYTPIVVVAALVLGIGVPLVLTVVRGGFDATLWHDWVYRACSLLVVACPCALVISTPVSFVSALSCAARNGVLVKGGAYFDIATKVTHVAFDKTGTLTTGNPAVTEVVPLGGASENAVLEVAAALEGLSTHPLAGAVVAEAKRRELRTAQVEGAEEIAAAGVRGLVDGDPCAVGKPAFALADNSLGEESEEVRGEVMRLGSSGATALVVSRGGRALGIIGVADTLRANAVQTVAALKEFAQVEMLTGDNSATADAMAREAGIELVSAELLPQNKLERIDELQHEGTTVAMVGDGMNDAPALAKADLGVTMGAAASDTALEVADVALLSDGIEQLPEFFALAVRTMHVVRENIAFAISVKMLVFVLVIAGVAGMSAAVFADTGVALLVVLNGMRLMRRSRLRW